MRLTITLLALLFFAPLAPAADPADFSEVLKGVEAMPILKAGICSNAVVKKDHDCTLYCIVEKACEEGYLLMRKDEQVQYIFRAYRDSRPSVLVWQRGAEL